MQKLMNMSVLHQSKVLEPLKKISYQIEGEGSVPEECACPYCMTVFNVAYHFPMKSRNAAHSKCYICSSCWDEYRRSKKVTRCSCGEDFDFHSFVMYYEWIASMSLLKIISEAADE